MKKEWKHIKNLMLVVLALGMLVFASVTVQASTYTNETMVMTYQKEYNSSIDLGLISSVPIKNLKSSNTSVLTVAAKRLDGDYRIFFNAKKPGTATISYKLGKDTYKQKVIIKKYRNVMKKITVNGKDITSQFNKKSTYTLSYEKYKNKTIKIKVSRNGNWGMYHGDYCAKNGKILKCMVTTGGVASFKVTHRNSSFGFGVQNIYSTDSVSYNIVFK